MPTYGYQCNNCNRTFEVFQKITDEPLKECENCHGELRRLLYPVGIVFKGPGFHINDYRKPENTSGNTPSDSASSIKADSKETSKAAS